MENWKERNNNHQVFEKVQRRLHNVMALQLSQINFRFYFGTESRIMVHVLKLVATTYLFVSTTYLVATTTY